MSAIKMLNDDTRFYIVIENPSNEEKLKAMQLVGQLFSITEEVKADRPKQVAVEEVPEGVISVKVEETVIPESAQEVESGSGIKEVKPVYKYIDKISTPREFVENYLQYESFDSDTKKWLIRKCGWFMKNYFNKMDVNDVEQVKTFLLDFQAILPTTIGEILTANGYSSLIGFLNTANTAEIISMFDRCKCNISEGLKI